jgi:PKD repeat protein
MLLPFLSQAQNCTFIQEIDTANNAITFIATDTASSYNYIFILDTNTVLNNLTGGHSATYQGFVDDTLNHEVCFKIVDLINQVLICEVCTTFQLGATPPPPSPSCAFTYYFSNDTLYASQSGSTTPANYVWTINGNFYPGTQLALYVGNIDSIQVNLNGQNIVLGTNCFNTMYALNPNYTPPSPSCAFTYYFSNDTLYAIQSGSVTPADYVWSVNGSFYPGNQLTLYVGNIDSIQVNLNGQNIVLGTNCFNTMYAVNPGFITTVDYCQTNFEIIADGLTNYFIETSTNYDPLHCVYEWNFGDGVIANQRYTQHTYNIAGDYNVCLWVKDTVDVNHCNDTICKLITVTTQPPVVDTCIAYFVFTQIETYSIGAINLASGTNPQFTWNFGDGPQSMLNGAYPSYTYMQYGSYEVCLTVTTDNCTHTFCDSLTVDSLGIMRGGMQVGFTINALNPVQLTGVKDSNTLNEDQQTIIVFPNPSTGIFSISLATNIEVYNLIGDIILSENNATSIDLTAAPKGMYFVKLNGGRLEKLIKN